MKDILWGYEEPLLGNYLKMNINIKNSHLTTNQILSHVAIKLIFSTQHIFFHLEILKNAANNYKKNMIFEKPMSVGLKKKFL